MHALVLCKVLVTLSISSALGAGRQQFKGCNYKDIVMQDAEITKMGPIMDKSKTILEAADKDGKRALYGVLAFLKDLPMTAQLKWEVFAIEDNNEPKKKAEGKETSFCKYLIEQKVLADMLLRHSNLSATCPWKKGSYAVTGSGPDKKVLPCRSPGSADVWQSVIKIFETGGRVILEVKQIFRLIRT